jgi:hypothetical protein
MKNNKSTSQFKEQGFIEHDDLSLHNKVVLKHEAREDFESHISACQGDPKALAWLEKNKMIWGIHE